MPQPSSSPRVVLAPLCAWLVLASALQTQAETLTFTVDPAQSQISLSGSAVGGTFREQATGSLTTRYTGTIQLDLTGATVQFMGGSRIEAQNSGSWSPKADGSDGNEPANYGGSASVLLGSAKAALRHILLDTMSGGLTLENGTFDAGGLTFFFPANAPSSMAYRASLLFGGTESGAEALAGYATNRVSQRASLTTAGQQQTLTIPVSAEYFFELLSPADTIVKLEGQLVATRTVPVTGPTLAIRRQDQQLTLTWQGEAGKVYRVVSSSDLKTWGEKAANITSATTSFSWTTPIAQQTEYFRVVW